MRSSGLRFLGVVGSTLTLALAVGAAAATRAAGRFTWARPVLVDHQPHYAHRASTDAISCPSITLCVAVDDAGGIVASTHPSQGGQSWKNVYLDGVTALGISCPNPTFCAAVDDNGNVLASRAPSGRGWSRVHVDRTQGLRGISCASASLCVAFDTSRLYVSTDPWMASAWRELRLEPHRSVCPPNSGAGNCREAVMAVSCPSRSFCAVVDNAGNVITSTRPTGGRAAWRSVHVDRSRPSGDCIGPSLPSTCSMLLAISCRSRSLCVAGDNSGNLFTSTRPRGDSSAWRSWYATPKECKGCAKYPVRAISCPSARFCAALDDWGNVLTSTQPTSGARFWSVTRAPKELPFPYHTDALACPSTALCVALRSPDGSPTRSNALVSTHPLGGTSAWRLKTIPTTHYDSLRAIACPSASLCVAADDSRHLITSTRPAGGASAWRVSRLAQSVLALSCPSVSLCVGVDSAGAVLTSRRPADGARAWTRTAGPAGLGGLSCPTTSLCVGFSGNEILATSDPAGGPSAWTVQYSATGTAPECGKYGPPYNCPVPAGISEVFCRSANLCLALDEFGAVVSSTDPTGGTGAWQTRPLDPWCYDGTCDDSVTCPSTSFCLASGSNSVFTSLAPGSGEWAIDSPRLPAGSSPPAVSPQSCPGTHRCVGVNSNGDLLVSSSPARAWTTSTIAHQDVTDPAYGYSIVLGPTGVSCPSRSLCIAIDALGNVLVGKRRAAG